MKKFTVGTRVRIKCEVDLFPHTIVRAGQEGEVVWVYEDGVDVRLDTPNKDLQYWNNTVKFSTDSLGEHPFFDDHCEVMA